MGECNHERLEESTRNLQIKTTLLENETDLNFKNLASLLGLGLYNQISGPYKKLSILLLFMDY